MHFTLHASRPCGKSHFLFRRRESQSKRQDLLFINTTQEGSILRALSGFIFITVSVSVLCREHEETQKEEGCSPSRRSKQRPEHGRSFLPGLNRRSLFLSFFLILNNPTPPLPVQGPRNTNSFLKYCQSFQRKVTTSTFSHSKTEKSFRSFKNIEI